MRHGIVIERGETSYGAYVPNLLSCVAIGETLEKVKELIARAIHLEGLREENVAVSAPTSTFE